jgi:flagella basal body P-ring formation protein FlgA
VRLLSLILAVTLFAGASAGGDYTVADRVEVEGEDLTLADLVPEAPVEWARVALGRAPRPDGERTLNREWILRRARQVGAQDQLEVPEAVVVTRPGTHVRREDIVTAVEQEVAGLLGPEERVRVSAVGLPAAVPGGEIELEARLPDGPLPSPATVWVDVYADGERVARAWARVEVFRNRPALVLVRNVRRGDVLGAADVEVRSGATGWAGLSAPEDAIGKRVTRSLRAGSPLGERDLEAVPVVDRGDVLLLVARVGGVVASMPGKALESAGIGEMMRVENLTSGQMVSGVLQDGGVVEVTAGRGR